MFNFSYYINFEIYGHITLYGSFTAYIYNAPLVSLTHVKFSFTWNAAYLFNKQMVCILVIMDAKSKGA